MAKRPSQNWLLHRPKPEPSYLQALRLYWQGEADSAISAIVDQISEGTSQQTEALYRLWIEILAQQDDESALRALTGHQHKAGANGLLDPAHAHALLALVHYELGEREAALIFWKPLQKRGNECYQRELVLLLDDDSELRDQAAQTLLRISGDFFHLRRVALHFHSSQDGKSCKKSLAALDELFEANPLRAEIGFHQAFGAKNYERALSWAKDLRQHFPINPEYQFNYAYCSYLTKNNEQALQEFLSLNRRFEGRDPDALSLLGMTLLKDIKTSEQQIEMGRRYLVRAKERLAALGLPTRYTEDLLMRLSPSAQHASGKNWIVKLTANQGWEISQRSEDSIRRLRKAMGNFVGKGDLCFFVTETRVADNKAPGIWRLQAIYQASAEPEWHPQHRWQTALDLVVRLEVAVPIEIEGNQLESKRHPASTYGLLEIEADALSYLEDSILDFTLEDASYVHIIEHLRTARAG